MGTRSGAQPRCSPFGSTTRHDTIFHIPLIYFLIQRLYIITSRSSPPFKCEKKERKKCHLFVTNNNKGYYLKREGTREEKRAYSFFLERSSTDPIPMTRIGVEGEGGSIEKLSPSPRNLNRGILLRLVVPKRLGYLHGHRGHGILTFLHGGPPRLLWPKHASVPLRTIKNGKVKFFANNRVAAAARANNPESTRAAVARRFNHARFLNQ